MSETEKSTPINPRTRAFREEAESCGPNAVYRKALLVIEELETELTQARADLERVTEELSELRTHVKEWFCENCHTVYQGPPQKGTKCVVCPKCNDDSTLPRQLFEIRKRDAELAAARAENDRLLGYVVHNDGCVFNETTCSCGLWK